MGIYIKGMEMPKGIEMLVVFSDGTVHKCLPGMREYVEKGTAVPLLSHGRLIDADAYIAYCGDKWIPLNIDAVNAQPTIIPAEKAPAEDINVSGTHDILYEEGGPGTR